MHWQCIFWWVRLGTSKKEYDRTQHRCLGGRVGRESAADEVLGRIENCFQPGLCQVSTIWSGDATVFHKDGKGSERDGGERRRCLDRLLPQMWHNMDTGNGVEYNAWC